MKYTIALLIVVLATVAALAIVSRADARKPKTSSTTFHCDHWTKGRGCQDWQYRWRVWLPDKWQRVGACETGYGRRPGNWQHRTRTYQGAFGFHEDSWDGFKPVPWWPLEAYLASPWQQYRTALAIHKRYGFSGWGCRNA